MALSGVLISFKVYGEDDGKSNGRPPAAKAVAPLLN